jgi:hypothetical protein
VETACKSDANALIPAIESIKNRNLSPKEIQADALYGSDENHQAAKSEGIDLVSHTMRSTKQNGLSLSDFELLNNGQVERCPQGSPKEELMNKQMNSKSDIDGGPGLKPPCRNMIAEPGLSDSDSEVLKLFGLLPS